MVVDLRDFNKNDWQAYAGCDYFHNGGMPCICDVQIGTCEAEMVGDPRQVCVMYHDHNGLEHLWQLCHDINNEWIVRMIVRQIGDELDTLAKAVYQKDERPYECATDKLRKYGFIETIL